MQKDFITVTPDSGVEIELLLLLLKKTQEIQEVLL